MSEELSEILVEAATGGPQPNTSEDEEPSVSTEAAEDEMELDDMTDEDDGDDSETSRGAFDHF